MRTVRHSRPLPKLTAAGHEAIVISTIVLTTGLAVMLIGLWGVLTHRNILRIIISLSLFGTGTHILIVAIGYVRGGTAPIIDSALTIAEASVRAVDPVPSALVVTAIVIGLAVTAVLLAYAIRLYAARKTLSIDAFTESKW
jgi:multicomponent Na+:H+ antiporter subunit C